LSELLVIDHLDRAIFFFTPFEC